MPGTKPTLMQNIIIWVVIPILLAANQLVLKAMAISLPHTDLGLGWLGEIGTNPWLLAVLVCEIVTFVLWLGVLKTINLSRATPITAISYVMILISGWLFFGETVHVLQILGVVAIASGLQLLGDQTAS
jgi:drug/metabolite transporter (DMT)-like permease